MWTGRKQRATSLLGMLVGNGRTPCKNVRARKYLGVPLDIRTHVDKNPDAEAVPWVEGGGRTEGIQLTAALPASMKFLYWECCEAETGVGRLITKHVRC